MHLIDQAQVFTDALLRVLLTFLSAVHDFEVLHVFGFLYHGHGAHRLLFLMGLDNLLRNLLRVVNFDRAVVLNYLLRGHRWS